MQFFFCCNKILTIVLFSKDDIWLIFLSKVSKMWPAVRPCKAAAHFSPPPRLPLGVNTSSLKSGTVCDWHPTLPCTDLAWQCQPARPSQSNTDGFRVTWRGLRELNSVPRISSEYQPGSLLQLQPLRHRARPQPFKTLLHPGPPVPTPTSTLLTTGTMAPLCFTQSH